MLTAFCDDSFCCKQVLVVAKAAGVPLTCKAFSECGCKCMIDNACEKSCCLSTPQGFLLGSNAICQYISALRPETGLGGRTIYEQAKVTSLNGMIKKSLNECRGECGKGQKLISKFNCMLEKSSFLVSDRMTTSDILFALAVDENKCDLSSAPHVKRLVDTVLGFCGIDACATCVCSKENKKTENQKSEKKIETTEPAKAPAPADGDDDEDKPSKKAKNPLDSLPPTSMDLDAWKRCYSNIKTEAELRTEAMKYLWENYDAQGWSFWFCDNIKAEGEGTQDFMSSNMAKGYLQCVEPNFRKYSFGILDVVGEKTDPNGTAGSFDIKGIMMVRGQDLPAELAEHRSCDSWKYRKLDPVADKKLIEDYFCSFEKVEGKTIQDSKVWK